MNFEQRLVRILEKSIEKNGNQPLTLQHLVNIINMIIEEDNKDMEREDKLMDELLHDQLDHDI